MNERFIPCTIQEIEPFFTQYIESLSSPIDSYLEDHILESEHFLITLNNETIGYFSIHQKELLTQFFLTTPHRAHAQEIFYNIKRMQFVQFAYVPTADEFFLAHAIDDCKNINKQAYFFVDSGNPIARRDPEVTIRLADISEIEAVRQNCGKFFGDNLEIQIRTHCVYFAERRGEIVGFGIVERGRIVKNYASIGMYTVPSFRQKGVGRTILLALKDEMYKENLIPIAGCWYYNHNSKKTLESAGMYTATRLLKISY